MATVDVTAVNAHNALVAALALAMYRPLRKVGGGAVDPLILSASAAVTTAKNATNAATQNPSNSQAVAFQYRRLNMLQAHMLYPLGVRRRRAMRSMRKAAMLLATIHTANTP
jgi:hypothetical protein